MEIDPKRAAAVFKAFCDENRIRILQLLSSGEKCACKLSLQCKITHKISRAAENKSLARLFLQSIT